MLSKKIKEFNEHFHKSERLQLKLTTITSPLELIELAKQEGFELTREDFKELANNAYQAWLKQLNEQTGLFFAKVHLNPELNQKLYQCNSKNDVLTLANECGFYLTESDVDMAAEIAESIQGFSFEKVFFKKINHKNNS